MLYELIVLRPPKFCNIHIESVYACVYRYTRYILKNNSEII